VKAPAFWATDGLLSRLLTPLALVYQAATVVHRRTVTSRDVGIPVICVGNLVAGGAGKTPVALSIAARLISRGHAPAFLTRGHGGRLSGPARVEPGLHQAADVGDEALLLAEAAPTWLSRDRAAGALAARDSGAELIIMDDGFQNPGLRKTLSLIVIDVGFGFGNRRLHPAGPMRETIDSGLARADAVVMIGEDRTRLAEKLPSRLPLLRAEIVPDPNSRLTSGTRVLGFAGIGRPEKFRETLEKLGLEITGFEAFADHHVFTDSELEALLNAAAQSGAIPVTTAKDHVRLPPMIRARVERVDIRLAWQDETALDALLEKGLADGPG
jgi:tetraacyldisaccharide 4'-kinase